MSTFDRDFTPAIRLAALAISSLLVSCAGQECQLNSDCPGRQRCEIGRCVQDCAEDIDCRADQTCSALGLCVGPDAGPSGFDAGPSRRDAGPTGFDAGPSGFDAGPSGFDAGPSGFDAGPSGFDAGGNDAGPSGFDAGFDAGPPTGPVARGTYRYTALPFSGGEGVRVAFHPDASYAVILERTNFVQIYDWATRTTQRVSLDPPGSASVYFHDLAFDPSGSFAYIVGADVDSGAETGVLFRMDDALVRAGSAATAFTRSSETRAGERFAAIEYPLAPRTGPPVLLSTTPRSPYIARLREVDTATDTFTGLFTATPTSAGCMDLAFANNEFGGWGIVLVCGINGGDAPYYTEIGAPPYAWRSGPSATLGNTYRAASYPTGAYALGIGASGWGNIHRFQDGAWRPASSSPSWTTKRLWGVAFQEGGQRALVFGQAGGSPLSAPVLEYRHDLWTVGDVTDVSIPNFDMAPYLGDSSTILDDAAFRPGCDGGLIVGGKTDFRGSRALVIEFRVEGLRSCGGVL